jgi:hypothetical protein
MIAVNSPIAPYAASSAGGVRQHPVVSPAATDPERHGTIQHPNQ